MSFSSTIAAIRYGYGFAPFDDAPRNMNDLLAQLANNRPLAKGAGASTQESLSFLSEYRRAKKAAKKDESKLEAKKQAQRQLISYRQDILQRRVRDTLAPQTGYLERLISFWMDHFSVSAGKSLANRLLSGAYVEEAIRANVTTSFPKMLSAVIQHPAMLEFLDQNASAGPASPAGKNQNRGLNENLARELLELHTLGVGGSYTQKDVRQLAELLTGMTFRKKGFLYNKKMAEPGAEQVLGQTYGGNGERLENIHEFLDDVSRHPDTARHIALKLVTHFVSDTPDESHVAQVAEVFFNTEGDFGSVYEALLDHPNAWIPLGHKVKQPFDFIISGFRAYGVESSVIANLGKKDLRQTIAAPLALMGQNFMQPSGPDGWAEDAQHWITPQGLAGRIQWASIAAQKYGSGLDPRDFVVNTLQDYAGEDVIFAATRAEVREEGLTLVLASPEFNRR